MFRIIIAILTVFLMVGMASADYQVTCVWDQNTDAHASHYGIFVDGVEVVANIPITTTTEVFTVTAITGQQVFLRTYGDTGSPTDFLDTAPGSLVKMTTPTTGFSVTDITWTP